MGLYLLAGLLLLSGIIFLILPIHMLMTGVVLFLLGAACLLCRFLQRSKNSGRRFLGELLSAAACTALILLMTCMGLITAGETGNPSGAVRSEYAIVLGASVSPSGAPSKIMRGRLEAAMDFMAANPDAVVILSGGQGSDEPTTEAECMYQTLCDMGADPDRLLLEDQSHTTRENLINSCELIDGRGGTGATITLITSEFHICRALLLGEHLGLQVCGWPADNTPWFYRINYTLREVFAMVKAMLQTA